MSGLVLSGGTLVNALQGKRVYQPIWQIIAIQNSVPGTSSSQLLVSDGKQLSYNVALHPICHITFDKSQWKNQNSGKSAEDIFTSTSSRYPFIKVMEFMVKKGDNTSVLFISKARLMGFEKSNKGPDILRSRDVEVIMDDGYNVVTRSKEGLKDFDVPGIELCESEQSSRYKEATYIEKPPIGLLDAVTAASAIKNNVWKKERKLSQSEFIEGILAPLGPQGLNLLTLCEKCQHITYTRDNSLSQFKPPAKMLMENMTNILPGVQVNYGYETCVCDEENEQFRKEFQNKCMVVNQDTSSGSERKVQCILVSKDKEELEHRDTEMAKLKLTHSGDTESEDAIKSLVPVVRKEVRVSSRLRLCEHCGVEEKNMTACRHCAKVWYCSASCKKANMSKHTSVCRAYITVRRFVEEKVAFARKLQEPEDGCVTCGFWRETLEACTRCQKVSYCSYRCRDKGAERHKPVCEAFTVIQNYRQRKLEAKGQEVD